MPVFVAMGVVYWVAMAMAMAIAVAAVGLAVVAAVAFYAVIVWLRNMGRAARTRDWPWAFDLALAPAVGLLAGTYVARNWKPIYAWGEARGFESGDPPVWFLIVGPVMALAFFYGIFGTYYALSRPRLGPDRWAWRPSNAKPRATAVTRLGSHLGFAFYGGYAGLLLSLGRAGLL